MKTSKLITTINTVLLIFFFKNNQRVVAPSNMKKKLIFIGLIILVLGAWKYFDVSSYLSLESLQNHRVSLQSHYSENPWLFIGIYFSIYVISQLNRGRCIENILLDFHLGKHLLENDINNRWDINQVCNYLQKLL